jgi:hypothetical protein
MNDVKQAFEDLINNVGYSCQVILGRKSKVVMDDIGVLCRIRQPERLVIKDSEFKQVLISFLSKGRVK